MSEERKIEWIKDTPLGISIYSADRIPTQLHENMLEIIFCLKGEITLSYGYEDIPLRAGEFVSIDKDAYYLCDGADNICISFYINLNSFESKYPFITSALFVCEGTGNNLDRPDFRQLKGTLISLLKYLADTGETDICRINYIAERIIKIFISRFDILFYWYVDPDDATEELMDRYHRINTYMYEHFTENITVNDLADELNLTPGYVSEYLRKISVGFRNMLSYRRANMSEPLLLDTDSTIVQISEECGFSDVKYFYSAFKKWYNCTPAQFRKKYGANTAKENTLSYYSLEDIKDELNGSLVNHYLEMFLK